MAAGALVKIYHEATRASHYRKQRPLLRRPVADAVAMHRIEARLIDGGGDAVRRKQSVTIPAFDQEVQQMVINRVGPLSAAKIAGTLYAILGLIFGAIISMIAVAGGLATNSDEPGAGAMGAIFGAGAVILLPILYGCLGFLMTLLMTALFNMTARVVGGVQIDVS